MELSAWLSQQNRSIRQNAKVVTLPQAYHISNSDKIKRFIPQIGFRQADSEDRTIPRVCCSPNLVGAIVGHAAVSMNTIDSWFDKKLAEVSIYQMPFKEYIRPNTKLVYDADASEEHWVVPNDPSTVSFKAPLVGKFIMYKTGDIFDRGMWLYETELIVYSEQPLCIHKDIYQKGYFKISLELNLKLNKFDGVKTPIVKEITPTTAAEYRSITKLVNKNIN